MKNEEQINTRINQLIDEILFTNAGQYQNFYKGSDLESRGAIRGAMLALKWVLEEND